MRIPRHRLSLIVPADFPERVQVIRPDLPDRDALTAWAEGPPREQVHELRAWGAR
jgi:hypothetical protein